MKKIFAFTLLAAASLAATAQTNVQTDVRSVSETQVGNIGNTTIVLPANFGTGAAGGVPGAATETVIRQHGIPVASAGPTYVNGPSNDTCIGAGSGLAAQLEKFGLNFNMAGEIIKQCDTRSDAVNLKVTGASQLQVMMRQCQNPSQAAAFEDAADLEDLVIAEQRAAQGAQAPARVTKAFRCPERLRPQFAKDREAAEAAAAGRPVAQTAPVDPYIAMSGRRFPSTPAR